MLTRCLNNNGETAYSMQLRHLQSLIRGLCGTMSETAHAFHPYHNPLKTTPHQQPPPLQLLHPGVCSRALRTVDAETVRAVYRCRTSSSSRASHPSGRAGVWCPPWEMNQFARAITRSADILSHRKFREVVCKRRSLSGGFNRGHSAGE